MLSERVKSGEKEIVLRGQNNFPLDIYETRRTVCGIDRFCKRIIHRLSGAKIFKVLR